MTDDPALAPVVDPDAASPADTNDEDEIEEGKTGVPSEAGPIPGDEDE